MKKRILPILLVLLCIIISSAALLSGCGEQSAQQVRPVYRVRLFYDPFEKSVTGEEDVEFFHPYAAIDTALFNLYANAFREGALYKPYSESDLARVFPKGVSYAKLEISDVKAEGDNADFAITGDDKNILAVSLPKTYAKGEKISLSFSFKLYLPAAAHRMGISEGIVNFGNAIPTLCAVSDTGFVQNPYYAVGDPFVSDVSDFLVTLDLPKGFTAAFTGEERSCREENDRRRYEIEASNVRDFGACFSNVLLMKETDADGVRVRYFYYKDQSPEKSLESAADALKFFSKAFSKYPYAKFDVAETPFYQGGMEYGALVYISSALKAEEYESVIVHETAHQWWYGLCGSDSVNSAWIDEGLAEFSLYYYYKKQGRGREAAQMINSSIFSYSLFREVMAKLQIKPDGVMNKPLPAFVSESEYTAEVYLKGLLLHASLYEILSEEVMLDSLRKYLDKYSYARPSEREYIDCYPAAAKSVFDAWLSGKVVIVDFTK